MMRIALKLETVLRIDFSSHKTIFQQWTLKLDTCNGSTDRVSQERLNLRIHITINVKLLSTHQPN